MTDIADGRHHTPDPSNALLALWHNLLNRRHQVLSRKGCRRKPLHGTDAEIRRQAARDVPAYLCRDLGLDPDVL